METLGCTELWIFRSLGMNGNWGYWRGKKVYLLWEWEKTFKNKNIQISGCEAQITSQIKLGLFQAFKSARWNFSRWYSEREHAYKCPHCFDKMLPSEALAARENENVKSTEENNTK